jgi:hypothetical protein
MRLALLHSVSWNTSYIHVNIKYLIIHFTVMSYFNLKKFEIDIKNLTSVLAKNGSQRDLRITDDRFDK